MTHKDCEEWAAMIAQMQDDSSWHPKYNSNNKGDSYAHIPNYVKYNIESTERGHIIKIITETGVHTYNCEWETYKRTSRFTKKETY